MKEPLSMLLVDDNPDDRALVIRELRREFQNVAVQESATSRDLSAALENPHDLVITDYQLRWSDGIAVLRAVKDRWPDCPVIMFTGTGSEEIAVEAMKSGLDDYVLKSPRHYVQLVTAVRSTLERVSSARRAARLEVRLQNLLDHLNVGVFRMQENGVLIEANRALGNLLGAFDPCGRSLESFFVRPEDFLEGLEAARSKRQSHEPSVQLRRADGSPIWVALTQTLSTSSEGEVLIDGLVEDVTERVRLETQLRHSQKMESVGQLAAGVAHDFNNLLTIIQGYTCLLLGEPGISFSFSESLRQIDSAAERAANLTRQLLAFSRKQMMKREPLDLNKVVGNMAGLIQPLMGGNILLKIQCAPSLPKIEADPAMIEQILMNLALNARDAIQPAGQVTIRTDFVEIDDASDYRHPDAAPGQFVRLIVRDNGEGMDNLTLERVFEPFFTTKDVGKGTGLGLAAVYGIVKQHQGWIDVSSRPGEGASFAIYFPVVGSEEKAPSPASRLSRDRVESVF